MFTSLCDRLHSLGAVEASEAVGHHLQTCPVKGQVRRVEVDLNLGTLPIAEICKKEREEKGNRKKMGIMAVQQSQAVAKSDQIELHYFV